MNSWKVGSTCWKAPPEKLPLLRSEDEGLWSEGRLGSSAPVVGRSSLLLQPLPGSHGLLPSPSWLGRTGCCLCTSQELFPLFSNCSWAQHPPSHFSPTPSFYTFRAQTLKVHTKRKICKQRHKQGMMPTFLGINRAISENNHNGKF